MTRSRRGNETECRGGRAPEGRGVGAAEMCGDRARSVSLHRRLHPDRRARGAGFTLLELLIATAVGAVVLVVIQTTFFGALRLHNTTHARIDEDLTLHRALSIIRRDLSGLMLPGGVFSGTFQTENFSSLEGESPGERVSPDFYTSSGRIDGYNPFGDVQRVSYHLSAERASATTNLVRVVARNLLPVQEVMGDEELLLEGVTAASVSYYDGTGWLDTWDSTATSTLPKAIRFSLTLAGKDAGEPAAPIEIVVPVHVVTTATQREDEEAATP